MVQVVAYGAAVLVMTDSNATAAVLVALARDGIAAPVPPSELTSLSTYHLMAIVGTLAGAGGVISTLGHRRMLWAGLALFGLGGAASALAPVWAVLLAGRLAQGVAAALLLPAVLMLVMQDLPGEQRRKALVRWICWCGAGAVLALTGAGPLVSAHGWRTVYLLAAVGAFGLLAVLTALTALPRAQRQRVAWFDVAISLLPTGSLVVVGVVASQGSRWGWITPRTAVCGVVALGLAGAHLALRARAGRDAEAPQEQRRPGWSGLSSCLHGGIWLILLGLGASRVRPAGLDVIQWGWLLPVWVGLTVAAPCTARWGRRRGPTAVPYGSGLAALAACLLLVMMARTQQPGWGGLAAAFVGAGLGGLLTVTGWAGSLASEQASAGAALASARLLAGMAGVNGAASYLDYPLLGEPGLGHAGVLFGAVGLISLLATAALVRALPAIHASARRPEIAPPRPDMVVPPLTAEDEAAALRRLLVAVRQDVARMHDDVSAALARAQATAQEPVELDRTPQPPTSQG